MPEISLDFKFKSSREKVWKALTDPEILSETGKEKYFIAGSYAMVESVAKHLINTGILKKNIKKDTLIGY